MTQAGSLRKSPAYLAYHFLWASLDWLFPPRCGGCGMLGERFCAACLGQVVRLPQAVCPRCGEPRAGGRLCRNCRTAEPEYRALRSWAAFEGPLRAAMHRLKYRRDISLGEALAQPLIDFFYNLHWAVDVVLPVPLSRERSVERGYNQAALLARPLAFASSCRYNPDAIQRVRSTATQVGLTVEGRKRNVSGAFAAVAQQVSARSVLVVDDVATTGATIEACAAALRKAGAREVYGLTLARAILHQDGAPAPDGDGQMDPGAGRFLNL